MSYITPDNVLKNALELKRASLDESGEKGQIAGTLDGLHEMLHGRKFRGNNIMLERIMVSNQIFNGSASLK